MAVWYITKYELVFIPEFPGTANYISALQEMEWDLVLRWFRSAFLNPAKFECLHRSDDVS